jgi:asparagine synthase (glutamine-hydrolysing)
MSVQFGRWNLDGNPIEPNYLKSVLTLLAPYAPDGTNSHQTGTTCLAYGAFHTNLESHRERQPHVSSHLTITWDGRLDCRVELIEQLRAGLPSDPSDAEIVAAAYQRWRSEAFPKLIGDWAMAIYDGREHLLILAKDPIGVRPLYYCRDQTHICWSTLLDPLVLLGGHFALEEEYVTGWIAGLPGADLTPYAGIHSLPAASFLLVRPDRARVRTYWDFNFRKRICYRTDREYEEHFCDVFRASVRRRMRSDRPVLAELSGGMDSSSIVCMADTILANGAAAIPRLDTVSYYNDSEPNWNERPYFEKVEEKRGRIGCHIAVDPLNSLLTSYQGDHFAATPALACPQTASSEQLIAYMTAHGHRVLLSGIAGDEVLGGVPSPMPELADHLLGGHLRRLGRQSVAWALAQRISLIELAATVGTAFLPIGISSRAVAVARPAWISARVSNRYRVAFQGYDRRLKIFGPLPSFQINLITFEGLRRHITATPLSPRPLHDVRYPYLDRDLLEFLFSIPREQLLRPRERRSLMRRALSGIVPQAILHRRRKASAGRNLRLALLNLANANEEMILASLGIVNAHVLRENLDRMREGHETPIVFLLRTLQIENWLRHIARQGILEIPVPSESHQKSEIHPVEVAL